MDAKTGREVGAHRLRHYNSGYLFLLLQPYQIRIWIRIGRIVWDLVVISVNDHNYGKFSILKTHFSRSSPSYYSEQLSSFYISTFKGRMTL